MQLSVTHVSLLLSLGAPETRVIHKGREPGYWNAAEQLQKMGLIVKDRGAHRTNVLLQLNSGKSDKLPETWALYLTPKGEVTVQSLRERLNYDGFLKELSKDLTVEETEIISSLAV